jgi:hypothetical protein
MLTGRRAFEGNDVAEVIASIIDREPDLNSLPVATPLAIRRLLRRSLVKDHRRRLSEIADARLEIDEAIAEPIVPAAESDAKIRTGARWRAVAAASVLTAILLAGFAALYFRRAATELAINRFEISTLPTFDSISFALSPDGRQLVFIANAEGQQKLWIRPLDRTQAQPLLYNNQSPKTDTDLWALPLTGVRTPFPVVQTPFVEDEGQFSPDGQRFLMNVIAEEVDVPPITIVQNWTLGLKR